MERLAQPRLSGITSAALHTWGMVFLAIGTLGMGLVQNKLLNLGQLTPQALLEAMQSSQEVMNYATAALVMQALETCAVPIFAFLLAEGAQRTSNYAKYLFRIAGLALLTEVPYNLAMSGGALDLSSRNPVFGLAIAAVMLFFFKRYSKKSFLWGLFRVMITLCAISWCVMLRVENGAGLVLLAAVLWTFRDKGMMRSIIGATVSIVCTLWSMFYLAAPMGFLAVHFYNGEQGDQSRPMRYLAYPVILLLVFMLRSFV